MLSLAVAILFQQSGPLADLAKPMDGRSMRASSTYRIRADGKRDPFGTPVGNLDGISNNDNYNVAPGGTQVLLDVKGTGIITHIWMTFLGPEKQDWAPEGAATQQDMLLRIYWDGRARPGVEAPVGDFFAGCFGKRAEVISLPVVVTRGSAYNCFWNMPFRKAARIEIVNQGTKPVRLLYYNIDWIQKKSLPADTPYFYAQYRQEYPCRHGKDYVVLDTSGKGHYVGTVLAVRSRSPMWFGEGDEKISIDNENTPSVWGTGTEDYFLSAWGLQKVNTPYYGVPYCDAFGALGCKMSAYRWHINDPVLFDQHIHVAFEHFGWVPADESDTGHTSGWTEREDDYASVAFWYQTGYPTFTARAPSGAERRLPSLDRVVAYARDFLGSKNHGAGEAHTQDLDFYPDGPQLLYRPVAASGAWFEVSLRVSEKEPLRLVLNMTTSYDFGIYQPYLDGVKLGDPLDFYSPNVENQEFQLLDFWPTVGGHKLRLVCVGKSPLSAGFYLGIESVRLRERRPRVKQYGLNRNKDWTTNPIIYH